MYQRILLRIPPVERVMPAGIALDSAPGRGSQSIVIVVRDEEKLIALGVGGVEIDIEIVAVVPIVVPHPDRSVSKTCL